MTEGTPTRTDVPSRVLPHFAHASAQVVSSQVSADVLHIKGASLDPDLNPGRRPSSDADVLVRPEHLKRFQAGLEAADWVLWCDFDEGSLFEHAASYHHHHYGMLDVHQHFPGLHHEPGRAFDALWSAHVVRRIAGIDCAAPGPLGEHLLMLLHAARTPGRRFDIENHWTRLTPDEQQQVRALAADHGATVGLAAALGELDAVDDPEVALWHLSRDNSDRLGEWVARWRVTHGVRARLVLAGKAVRVNRFQLAQTLGRRPTRTDVWQAWWRRAGAGVVEVTRRWRR